MSKVKGESDERRGVEESKNVLGVLLEFSSDSFLTLEIGEHTSELQSLLTQLYTTEKS